jgi:RNA polymerase sigma-70 factor (ECF subfamily)
MPEVEIDIAACLERLRESERGAGRRDEAAARDLIQALYPLVLKLVRRHLPRRTAEEDLCQMIFVKLFQNLHQYSGAVPLEHWVSRIAVNTCLNQLRAEKVRPELRWADLSETQVAVLENRPEAMAESETEAIASREIVARLMEALNPADRLVIQLLHLEGRSVQEVKALTGWSLPLVKVRAFRARQRLKSLFQSLMQENRL